MKKYWVINCYNFENQDDIFYFENYEIAKKNFEILCEKNKNKEEFKRGENSVSWFDPEYDEFSTCIDLIEIELPTIYNEIIF